jgi:murein DD-endopeptidase MepM/ murein hydrolase activator NlpD
VAVAVAVVATGALVVLPSSVSGAGLQDDGEQLEEEVSGAEEALEHATEREREAAERYLAATGALPEAEARLEEAQQQVEAAERRAGSATAEEQVAVAKLADINERHRRLLAEVDRTYDRIDGLVSAAYKGGGSYSLSAVMAARDPGDLMTRLGFLDRISAREREALADLGAAKVAAEAALAEARQVQQQAEEARQAAQQALADARAARAEAGDAAAEVAALVEERAEALAIAKDEREKAEAEMARVEAELREWEEANQDGAPELQPGATLLMPVDGVKASDYGWREDPLYGGERLHAGVDFAAPAGTLIWAAADGVVMQAGWSGGYGNFTCLSHGTYDGQGLSTCYAHQSEIWVTTDEVVEAGQVIGLVGTTGDSTGNHLHFEVRLDGTPTDPLPWLPECLC